MRRVVTSFAITAARSSRLATASLYRSSITPVASFRAPQYANVLSRSFGSDSEALHDEPFLEVGMVTDRIIEVVKNFEKVDASKVEKGSRFKEDLDLDSLDAVEIVMAIEEEFCIEIPDAEADKIMSIADAVIYISSHPMAK
jgi:NADH dehydrogenase (ubiquinone) 1 alpha/beta subcomplex 1